MRIAVAVLVTAWEDNQEAPEIEMGRGQDKSARTYVVETRLPTFCVALGLLTQCVVSSHLPDFLPSDALPQRPIKAQELLEQQIEPSLACLERDDRLRGQKVESRCWRLRAARLGRWRLVRRSSDGLGARSS